MKKLIVKTALITLLAAVVLGISIFGVCSLFAPAAMMRFTASIGLTGVSGDYAYSAYGKTGELSYLAYSCEIAAETNDGRACERYELFLSHEGFSEYCLDRDEQAASALPGELAQYARGGYEQYTYGKYVCSLLRAGRADEAISYAVTSLKGDFPENNAVIALAMQAIKNNDKQVCTKLAAVLVADAISSNDECQEIISILEDFANE